MILTAGVMMEQIYSNSKEEIRKIWMEIKRDSFV